MEFGPNTNEQNEQNQGVRSRGHAPVPRGVRLVFAVLGFALYWPLFRKFEFSSVFLLNPVPEDSMWTAYSTVTIALALFLTIGVGLRREVRDSILRGPAATVLLSALGTVGYLLFVLSPLAGEVGGQIVLLGSLFVALAYTALTFAWSEHICRMEGFEPYACILVAAVLSAAFSLFAMIPQGVQAAITVLTPLGSGLFFLAYSLTGGAAGSEERGRLEGDVITWEKIREFPLALVAVFGCFLVVGRIAVGLLRYASPEILFWERLATVGIILSCALILLVAFFRVRHWDTLLQTGWTFLSVVFLFGMMAIVMFDGELLNVASSILSATLSCFVFVLWIALVRTTKDGGFSSVFIFGLATILVRVLPAYIGKYLVPSFFADMGLAVAENTPMFAAVMTLLLAATTILFLNARLFRQLRETSDAADDRLLLGAVDGLDVPGEDEDAIARATAERLKGLGLTQREVEVALLMGRGYSYQRVADDLGISLGTVQGHAKSIHNKMGIHSRQELIDVLSGADK